MSKFIVVKEKPEVLEEGDYLIDKPSFLDQIKLHAAKRPTNRLTGSHYIRMVTDSIGQAYDPENLTAYTVKAHNYEGLPINEDEDMDAIMLRALTADYPAIFPKYLEAKIRNRPMNAKRIVYVDSKIKGQYEIFYRNGFAEEEKPKSSSGKGGKTT